MHKISLIFWSMERIQNFLFTFTTDLYGVVLDCFNTHELDFLMQHLSLVFVNICFKFYDLHIINKCLTFAFCLWISGYRQAVNRAGKRVVFIDRYEDRTVYHDFFSQYGSSRLFVQQKVTFKKYVDIIWEKNPYHILSNKGLKKSPFWFFD